jgi:putative membrane protein
VTESDGWRRLHPVSPVVRAGRAAIAVFIVLVPIVLRGGGNLSDSTIQLGVVALLAGLGFVNWLVTRWRIEGDDLRIETGLIRRQSLRFPLAQVQAIDIVQPGLARIFRVAELRLRLGGTSGGTARLAYLPQHEVEPLRARLLRLATDGETAPHEPEAIEERVLTTVPTLQLVASIVVSDVGIAVELVFVALLVTALLAPAAAAGIVGGGAAELIAVATLVWRRFNQEYKLTVAAAPDGLRLRSGLVALNAETIRPGRVQAVRLVEPFLWRRLGWCRLEVDLAGRQKRKGEGEATRGQLRALLPVGSRALALELLEHLVPDAPRPERRAPRRVAWKSPLRYRFLAWGRTDAAVVTMTGRIRRVTVWVPLEKAQSLRLVEGPLQRRLRLVTVHVDTAGRALHAALRDRDRAEGHEALADLVGLARAARGSAPP